MVFRLTKNTELLMIMGMSIVLQVIRHKPKCHNSDGDGNIIVLAITPIVVEIIHSIEAWTSCCHYGKKPKCEWYIIWETIDISKNYKAFAIFHIFLELWVCFLSWHSQNQMPWHCDTAQCDKTEFFEKRCVFVSVHIHKVYFMKVNTPFGKHNYKLTQHV